MLKKLSSITTLLAAATAAASIAVAGVATAAPVCTGYQTPAVNGCIAPGTPGPPGPQRTALNPGADQLKNYPGDETWNQCVGKTDSNQGCCVANGGKYYPAGTTVNQQPACEFADKIVYFW
jgi:hypothetical protein